MEKFKSITSVVVVLLVATAVTIKAEVSVSTRVQQRPGQKFGYSSWSLDNGKFIYTVCDPGETQRICKVIQENILSGIVSHSCDIVLRIDEGMEFGLFLEIAFSKDKAILIWEEKPGLEQSFKMYIRFTTIQLDNCQVGEAKLFDYNDVLVREPIHHQLYIGQKIIMRDTKYDIFFEDRVKCGKHECQLTIDDRGRILNASLPSLNIPDSNSNFYKPYHPTFVSNRPYHIRMLKLLSYKNTQDEVFACLKMNKKEAIITVIRPGVSEKVAVTINSEESDIRGYSVEYETIGICVSSKNDSTLTCSSYDINGNKKSEVYLPDLESHMSSVYVLPNGGFLLLAMKLEYCQPNEDNCDTHPLAAAYRIIKVDAEGEIKEMPLKGFTKTRIGQYTELIYKNPDGQGYCVSVVYGNYVLISKYMGGKVEDRIVVTNCFTEADFVE